MKTIESLSNLTPETVLAIEGLQFLVKARALPGVQEASDSISEVEQGEDEIDVAHELRLKPEYQERMVVTDSHIVAGGLIHDEDFRVEDLGDCNGEIVHRGRRAWGDQEAKFYDALGMTSDGNRNYDDSEVCEVLSGMAWEQVRKDRSLRAVLQHQLKNNGIKRTLKDAVFAAGIYGGYEDDVASAFAGTYAMYRLYDEDQEKLRRLSNLFESLRDVAWEKAMEAGKIGNPLAIMLDIYEHGGRVYSLSGQGMQCRWDTTRGGALWIPDAGATENIRSYALSTLAENATEEETARALENAAREYCQGFLNEYNALENGEVYGVVVYVIDRKTGERIDDLDHEVWGHVGSEYAEETLESEILGTIANLANKH